MPRVDHTVYKRYTTAEGRFYTDGESVYPSVTTVLSQDGEPQGVTAWKERNDGKGGNPYWRDILEYKSARGTLIHYKCLNQFADVELWGENEYSATSNLQASKSLTRFMRERSFATETFEAVAERRGITSDSVIDVEQFCVNPEVGYAGQFDLLYENVDGQVTLADMKTGKSVYPKYKYQLAAYANAIDVDVDRVEVIRINPDNHDHEVSSSDQWDLSIDRLFADFVLKRLDMGDDAELRERVLSEGVNDG